MPIRDFIRFAVLVWIVGPRRLAPQEPAVPLELRTETRVVQIEVTVRDSHGRPVDDLTRRNFTVTDEGKPREIQIFSFNRAEDRATAPAPPPTLPPNVFSNANPTPGSRTNSTVLLLDGVNGWWDNFVLSRQAVAGMLDKISPDERIAVYVVSKNQGLLILQDYSTDRDLMLRNLARYTPGGMSPAPPGMKRLPCENADAGTQSPREKGLFMRQGAEDVRTALQALAERLAHVPGRKSVFWLTQGFPPSQLHSIGALQWDKTVTALNEANVAVNAVDSNGLCGPPRLWGPGAIQTMQEIAERTGGTAYYNRNDLDAAIAGGIQDSRSSYTLGFYLAEKERDRRFHRLSVRTDRAGLELHYRQGYYSGNDGRLDAAQKKMELETALLSPVDSDAVGIMAAVEKTSAAPSATLNIRLRLDPQTISLAERGGKWSSKIDLMFVEMNQAGRVVGKRTETHQLAIARESRTEFERRGLVVTRAIPLVDGAAKLVIVVRDTGSGRIGSLTAPLDNQREQNH